MGKIAITCLADAAKLEARNDIKYEIDGATIKAFLIAERDKLPKNKDGLIVSGPEFTAFRDVYKSARLAEYLRKVPDCVPAATMSRKAFADMKDGPAKVAIAEKRERVKNFCDLGFSRLMKGKLAKNGKRGTKGKTKATKVATAKPAPEMAKLVTATKKDEPLRMALEWAATEGKALFLKFAAQNMPHSD